MFIIRFALALSVLAAAAVGYGVLTGAGWWAICLGVVGMVVCAQLLVVIYVALRAYVTGKRPLR
ncbi:hypothetical protein [Paracoccus ravus]|uniref:hypothetical protein n=1 Tax=Paracoccus ravus TaxID=2447760 RepID=UPI00106E2F64|nr:hypothetical protein [Paracoccus ravus]